MFLLIINDHSRSSVTIPLFYYLRTLNDEIINAAKYIFEEIKQSEEQGGFISRYTYINDVPKLLKLQI